MLDFFSKDDFSNITNILETHIHILRNLDRYNFLESEIVALSDKISQKLTDKDLENFEELTELLSEMELYSNTLLYHLGFKYGNEIDSL